MEDDKPDYRPAWALVLVGCVMAAAAYGIAAAGDPPDADIGAGVLLLAGLAVIVLGLCSLLFLRLRSAWDSHRRPRR
jgi:tellurite resistance protein TehA-like permease